MLKDKELKAFFELLVSNSTKSDFTEELKDYIDDAKHNTQWRQQFMIWENNLAQAKKDAHDAGFNEGLNQGAEHKAIETAHNLLKQGILSAEQIAQVTGLTEEEIKNLDKIKTASHPSPSSL